jgi:hypothetical protein
VTGEYKPSPLPPTPCWRKRTGLVFTGHHRALLAMPPAAAPK